MCRRFDRCSYVCACVCAYIYMNTHIHKPTKRRDLCVCRKSKVDRCSYVCERVCAYVYMNTYKPAKKRKQCVARVCVCVCVYI